MQKDWAGHRLTKHVKLLQKWVLVHRGKVLLVKRANDAYYRANLWDLPGGNSEWPEMKSEGRDVHKDDAVREVLEETGIKLEVTAVGSKPIFFGTYFEPERELYSMIVGWRADLPDDFNPESVKLSAEHVEFAWAGEAEFEKFDFGFAGRDDGFIAAMLKNA